MSRAYQDLLSERTRQECFKDCTNDRVNLRSRVGGLGHREYGGRTWIGRTDPVQIFQISVTSAESNPHNFPWLWIGINSWKRGWW